MVEARPHKRGVFTPTKIEVYAVFNEEYGKLNALAGGYANLPAVRQDAQNLTRGCNELGVKQENINIYFDLSR